MRRIDELHLNHPFTGSRMLRDILQREGVQGWGECPNFCVRGGLLNSSLRDFL